MILEECTPTKTAWCTHSRPCMGGKRCRSSGWRLTPHWPSACCHWLSAFRGLLRPPAYDLCHASFLRPLYAISFTALRISWSGLLLFMHGCILRVSSGAFVFLIGQVGSANMQGRECVPPCGFGGCAFSAYHITWCRFAFRGSGCLLCVSFVVAFLGHLFLVLSGLACFVCCTKNTSYL